MEKTYSPTADIHVLPSQVAIPSLGILPVNAFVITAKQPVLVDTGLIADREHFVESLQEVIDPIELKWLWLSHTDQDHVGSVQRLLEDLPHLRVITTFLGVGKMGLFSPLPLDRVLLLNPGQSVDLGDRELVAIRPPIFDAPETTGFFDNRSRTLFSADCFGALVPNLVEDARDIPQETLAEGQRLWATVDAPWLQDVDETSFARSLARIADLSPDLILSNHLPAACGITDRLLQTMASATKANAFVGPDQHALESMLAGARGGPE